MRHARSRLGAVATFAVARVFVRNLLRGGKRGKKGNKGLGLAPKLADLAWWAVTYLTIPVIAREELGGLQSIARSASLFSQTWKEAFVGRFLVGWILAPIVVVCTIPFWICVATGVEEPLAIFAAIAFPALVGLALGVVLRTLDTVYRTALYVFATEGVVPADFDDPDLHVIFVAAREAD